MNITKVLWCIWAFYFAVCYCVGVYKLAEVILDAWSERDILSFPTMLVVMTIHIILGLILPIYFIGVRG